MDALDDALRRARRTAAQRAPRDPDPRRRRRPGLRPAQQADRALPARATRRPCWSSTARPGRTAARRAGAGSSPRPSRSRSSTPAAVHALVEAGFVVVANGGGGIPVVRDGDGRCAASRRSSTRTSAAALLARTVDVDVLVIATDVPHAVLRLRHPARPSRSAGSTYAGCGRCAAEGHFASGSMGPKVEAVCRFVEQGGTRAVITIAGPHRRRRRRRDRHRRRRPRLSNGP